MIKINLKYLCLLLCLAMLTWAGCKKEENYTAPGADALSFSTDTVKFDTIFTSIGSATQNFKIINTFGKNIKLDHIRLAGGTSSQFRINIDGRATTDFPDYELRAGDSAYIFVEVTVDPNSTNTPFVVMDSILFESQGHRQQVILQAFGQNANFLENILLPCNTTWTENKPYVLFGDVVVDVGCKLTIQAGTRIFAHRDSRLVIFGTLEIKGTADKPVIFQGDRLEPIYRGTPGQWLGIHLWRGSTAHIIEHAIIEEGTVGIRVDSASTIIGQPMLRLKKTTLRNHSSVGLLGYSTSIWCENSVIHSCGQANFAGELGGKYQFTHCTFENSKVVASKRQPSIFYSNEDYKGQPSPLTAEFRNCIIWGNLDDEIAEYKSGKGPFVTVYEKNILKAQKFKPAGSNIFNKYPVFKNQQKEDYSLDTLSPAENAGAVFPGFEVQDDYKDKLRDALPDIGAYER